MFNSAIIVAAKIPANGGSIKEEDTLSPTKFKPKKGISQARILCIANTSHDVKKAVSWGTPTPSLIIASAKGNATTPPAGTKIPATEAIKIPFIPDSDPNHPLIKSPGNSSVAKLAIKTAHNALGTIAARYPKLMYSPISVEPSCRR